MTVMKFNSAIALFSTIKLFISSLSATAGSRMAAYSWCKNTRTCTLEIKTPFGSDWNVIRIYMLLSFKITQSIQSLSATAGSRMAACLLGKKAQKNDQ